MLKGDEYKVNIEALLSHQKPIRYAGYWIEGEKGQVGEKHLGIVGIVPNDEFDAAVLGKGLTYVTLSGDAHRHSQEFRSRLLEIDLPVQIVESQAPLINMWDSHPEIRDRALREGVLMAVSYGLPVVFTVFDQLENGDPITTLWHPPVIPSAPAWKLLVDTSVIVSNVFN